MKCCVCGKEIKNPHYINGKPYGYNCYKQKLAIIYKQWEEVHNAEYSAKCFAAMEIFKNKKSNSFHDSVVEQWKAYKKITGKQLECIIKGFTVDETIAFYKAWFIIATKDTKKNISGWVEQIIIKNKITYKFVYDEEVHKILLILHPSGIHFIKDKDIEEPEDIFFCENGKWIRRKDENGRKIYDTCFLNKNKKDEYYQILNIIYEDV